MGCCRSKDEEAEYYEPITSSVGSAPRQVVVAPGRANIAASRGQVAPSRVLAARSSVNVVPDRANIAASRGLVAPSRVLAARSSVNVVPDRANAAKVVSSRVNAGSKYPDRKESIPHRLPTNPASTWDIFLSIPRYQPAETTDRDEVGSIGYSSHHNEERHFFHIFFSVLDHVPGHQGIFRRWEKEAQRAECGNAAERCDMRKVWLERAGYVKTLQRVKMLVYNKQFRASDREKLAEWAAKVVKRRTAEYNKAKSQGRADPQHMKVLEEWKGVKEAVLDLV